ncbi:YhcN/YlaJ family sporulation lipoprotein [Bacillus sp. JJ1122]|uniref:YhcN/YlaJ family sporulation lipoprotein n=1 Tax=Bacillus sp. JJ1122 TaxID=3122951 RepID=UPI003000B0C9
MKLIRSLSFILLTIAVSTGCAMNNGAREDVRDNNDTRVQNYDLTSPGEKKGARILNDNLDYNDEVQMRVHDEVKNNVEGINEVTRANVIVTDSTAYVAVVLNDNQTGTIRKDIEDKISDRVKTTDNSINNVYVSSNPDFVDRMSDYVNKIENGKPVSGLYDEFSEMVKRVFPTAR